MRKWLTVAAVAGLIVAPAGEAGTKRYKRTATDTYIAPSLGSQATGYITCSEGLNWGCAAVEAYPRRDRYVSIDIVDESGLPVAALLFQYVGDEYARGHIPICGGTDEPVKLEKGVDWVGVDLFEGPCGTDLSPAAATTGVVDFTFTRSK